MLALSLILLLHIPALFMAHLHRLLGTSWQYSQSCFATFKRRFLTNREWGEKDCVCIFYLFLNSIPIDRQVACLRFRSGIEEKMENPDCHANILPDTPCIPQTVTGKANLSVFKHIKERYLLCSKWCSFEPSICLDLALKR